MSATTDWKCYLLAEIGGSGTYVGVTPDLDRRLSQHNGMRAGGAKATSGRAWERVCHVRGFPDHRAALQFEWRWKQITRKYKGQGSPLARRGRALQELLALDKPTSEAIPYAEYPVPLEVVWESEREVPVI